MLQLRRRHTRPRRRASRPHSDTAVATVAAAPPAQAYAMYSKAPSVFRRPAAALCRRVRRRRRSRRHRCQPVRHRLLPRGRRRSLAVDATGRTSSGGVGFGGAHLGYEWSYGAHLRPALELEGFYLAGNQPRATLTNPNNVRLAEQTFDNTLPTRTTVLLANMVVSFNASYPGITPYIGGGIGAANVSINGATSTQTNPLEAGINHFNANPDSSAWTFAAQAKAGARFALGNSGAYLFGEYRYLYVGAMNQVFGSTVDPTHAATTPWTVSLGGTSHHLAAGGIGFSF